VAGGNILMVVMSMTSMAGPGAFGRSPSRSLAAGAIIITFLVLVLGLPLPFALRRRVCGHLGRRRLNIITTSETGVCEGKMSRSWTGHTEAASTGSYTGKHAAEFALDSRLAGRGD
jgi:hypothetical protein